MSLIERIRSFVLGERFAPPASLPEGSLPDGIVLRRGKLIPQLGGFFARMREPAAAVTLRRTIVVHPEAPLTYSLLVHELAHVRQWQEDPLFPFRYTLATLRHGYRNNPYEVEARQAASRALVPSAEDAS